MRLVKEKHDHKDDDGAFFLFAEHVRDTFLIRAGAIGAQLFRTDARGLNEIYLRSFPTQVRQHHTCNCCRNFIERFGGLVVIDADGHQHSAFWGGYNNALYEIANRNLRKTVEAAKVTGPFYCEDPIWGVPFTGGFDHFAVLPSKSMVHTDRTETAFQKMARKQEDHRTLITAIPQYDRHVVEAALELIASGRLYRGDKVHGPIKFLLDVHDTKKALSQKHRENRVWKMVADAPAGWCSPRSSMAGTLLDDLIAGKKYDAILEGFNAKMDPLQYQRPQAPAKAGNINAAEKIVEKMGIVNSLKRRFATSDDLEAIWMPVKLQAAVAEKGGVFGHLVGEKINMSNILMGAEGAITFEKFRRDVLPKALKIEALVDDRLSFTGFVTAEDLSAPPILQWDSLEKRNPVSGYLYRGPDRASMWNLVSDSWYEVAGIVLTPSMWGPDENRFKNFGKSASFIIDAMGDTRTPGLCLFPEILKSELHPVRATIEAHSNAKRLTRLPTRQPVAGVMVGGKAAALDIHVTMRHGTFAYKIDRWD